MVKKKFFGSRFNPEKFCIFYQCCGTGSKFSKFVDLDPYYEFDSESIHSLKKLKTLFLPFLDL